MSGIEVIYKTQRIIVLPHTSTSIVKAGPQGPQGPQGPPGLQGTPGNNLITSVNGRQGVVVGLAEQVDLEDRALLTDRRFDPARSNRVIYIGDSITFGDSNPADPDYVGGYDWPAWVEKLSDSQIIRYRNAGLGGNDSLNLLLDLQNTVLQYADNIGWCVVMCGTNDAYYGNLGTEGYTMETYIVNMTAVIDALRNAGIRPVLCTITPRAVVDPLGLRQRIEKYNVWLRKFASANGVPLIDFRQALIDSTTGEMKDEFEGDTLHPGMWGLVEMGRLAADELGPLFNPWTPPLADHQNSASFNLVTNGLFLNDVNADGVGDNWDLTYYIGGGTLITDSTILGKWQRLTGAGNINIFQSINADGWDVGDRLVLTGRIEMELPVGAGYGGPLIYLNGFTTPIRLLGLVMVAHTTNKHLGPFTFYREFTVPPGTNSIDLWLQKIQGNGATSGWVQFSQLTLLNLTRIGATIS